MAIEVGDAYLSILPKLQDGFGKSIERQLGPDFDRTGQASGRRLGTSVGNGARSQIGSMAKGIAAPLAAAFATVGVANLFKDAVSGASDLNETLNLNKVIFDKDAKSIIDWSKTSAKSYGLSQRATLNYTGQLGDMFKQLGFNRKETVKNSKSTIKLAADLGSFKNLETGDVLDRIGAAFRGEYDSLQLLIPTINAARVEKEALAETGKKNAAALTSEEKAAAVLAIVNKDGAAALNDFSETSDGLAGQQKILSASFDDAKDRLGLGLLPIITEATTFLVDEGVPAFERFSDFFVEKGIPAIQDFAEEAKPFVKSVLPAIGTGLDTAAGAVKIIAPAVKSIVDSFNSLPKAAQTAILGAGGAAYLGRNLLALPTSLAKDPKKAPKTPLLALATGPAGAALAALASAKIYADQTGKNKNTLSSTRHPTAKSNAPGGRGFREARLPLLNADGTDDSAAFEAKRNAATAEIQRQLNPDLSGAYAKKWKENQAEAKKLSDQMVVTNDSATKLDGSLGILSRKDIKPKVNVTGVGPGKAAVDGLQSILGILDRTTATPQVKVGGVRGALDGLAAIGDKIAALANAKVPKIGANAAGTDYWRGGLTLVGEKGPELIDLQRGAKVIPNHELSSVTAASSAGIASADIDRLVDAIEAGHRLVLGNREFALAVQDAQRTITRAS